MHLGAISDQTPSDEQVALVVSELEGLPPGRALDLGSGEGRNAVWLAARGWRVTAATVPAIAAIDRAV